MNIQGIKKPSKIEHKMVVYVDDILIFMNILLRSVGHLCQLLNACANVSWCKVKEANSVLLGLNILAGDR